MIRRIVVEWLFWISLSVFVFTVGTSVALLAPVLVLLAPVPFMMLACRQGVRESALGVLFGAVLVFLLMGPMSAVMYMAMFGLVGVAFGAAALRAPSGVDFVIAAMTASILTKVALMAAFTRISGVNPFAVSESTAAALISAASSALSGGGVTQAALQKYAREMAATVSLLMPSMLILFAAADTFVSYAVASRLLVKFGSKAPAQLPPFGEWRFPRNIFWALMAAIAVDLAGKAWPDAAIFKMLSANLMEVLRAVFMVEGLALCWFFMTKRGLNKALKVCTVAFCIFFSPVSYILSMVGIFDIWYDLRRRARRK